MITSLRLPTLLRFNGVTMGLALFLARNPIAEAMSVCFMILVWSIFANLRVFGDCRDFPRFLYFYSMDLLQIFHAICIHHLLEYSILNLYFLIQFSSHLFIFSFVKVKKFFLEFSRFWTRVFGLLFTFIMLLMKINLNFVDIDCVVRNLFGMAIVKTGPRQNGGKKNVTEELGGEYCIKSRLGDENVMYFTSEIDLLSKVARWLLARTS